MKDYRKPCTLCEKPRDVLVRCQIDDTARWHFVCPGTCWQSVSGGKIDGDGAEDHRFYRYGGMWKNKHEAVSAKKPKKKCKAADSGNGNASSALDGDGVKQWSDEHERYTRNDKVYWSDVIWICRRSHESEPSKLPSQSYRLWKEERGLVEDRE